MTVGIGMVTYDDYHFTAIGVGLTFLGTILATIKVSQERHNSLTESH